MWFCSNDIRFFTLIFPLPLYTVTYTCAFLSTRAQKQTSEPIALSFITQIWWWEKVDGISPKFARCDRGPTFPSIYTLFTESLPGGHRYLQKNTVRQQVIKFFLFHVLSFDSSLHVHVNSDMQSLNIYCIYAVLYFRDFLALNVYVALCYYKLDYYDVSQVSTGISI